MEQPPVNKIEDKENAPEKFPTKEEIFEFIRTAFEKENLVVVREESNTEGLYLIDVKSEETADGEVAQYEYMRKGNFGDLGGAIETAIYVTYYQDEIPIGGEKVAVYDHESGNWVKI